MSDSKLKKAFNGAVEKIRGDLRRNLFVAGFTTAGMGLAAVFSVIAAPSIPLFAAGFFVGENVLSGAIGAYKNLKNPKP